MSDNNAYVVFHWTVLKLKKERERERKTLTYKKI